MKRLIVISAILLLISTVRLYPQYLVRSGEITSVCYAGDKVKKMFIPPPKEFFEVMAGKANKADITVYYSDVPAWVKTPVNYAVSILESILPADLRMTVYVTVSSLEQGVLANSGTGGFADGREIDAFLPNAYYPVALAERIYGEELNSETSGDIVINLNTGISWYVGTDGNTPTTQYDLVTVIIHETIHGLGFFDSMYADASTGVWGTTDSRPLIYDVFVENADGQRLIDTTIFENPSSELKDQITSDKIYFNGPLLRDYYSGDRAKLYAPSTYDPGSSIAHLDEDTYQEIDAIMTPFIDRGEAIHNPGSLTMSILGDLGWVNTRFVHDNPADTEEHLSEVNINATIISDTIYSKDQVGLVWSFDNFSTCDTVFMTSPLSDDNYSATIQIPYYEARLEYYMYTEDYFERMYRSPSYISEYRHDIFIGMDTVKPSLSHTAAEYFFELVDTIQFDAFASDNVGIEKVSLEYRVNDGEPTVVDLVALSDTLYSTAISTMDMSLDGGDSLRYRITAYDKALNTNVITIPDEGYFTVGIEDIGVVVNSYSTDFTDAADDFFNKGFRISKPENFTSYGLHTDHPYESPEKADGEYNFTAMLRHPVRFDAHGMIISYSELALVEPGEEGSEYGSEDFYDYVIVETSQDYGKTWQPLFNGYDARSYSSWETAYNSAFDSENMNSTFEGNGSMMIKRTVFPKITSSISEGDTLLFRFRLFSDPFANGWGWAIEDLHIGPLVDNVANTGIETIVVYPNPGNGVLMIKDSRNISLPYIYEVYNTAGILLKKGSTDNGEMHSINIGDLPRGIYLIVLQQNNIRRIVKYILL